MRTIITMSNASGTTLLPATGGFTEDAFHRFLKGRDEPSWLVERRREAFGQFRAFPWPSGRDEEWRRTDIRALKLDAFAPPAAEDPGAEDDRVPHLEPGVGQLLGVVVDPAGGPGPEQVDDDDGDELQQVEV